MNFVQSSAPSSEPPSEPLPASSVMVAVRGVCKRYGVQPVLNDVSFEVRQGEVIVLLGPSGSGKSTLLRCINFLEEYESGTIVVDGETVGYRDASGAGARQRRTQAEIAHLRAKTGMVFQHYNLFPHKSALANIMMGPMLVHGEPRAPAREHALALLEKVGLADQAQHYPSQLSGGQQQRVAIARALAMRPKVMLFDEVTSALDPELVDEVLKTLKDLSRDGMTMIIVTHEMGFARDVADRVLFFHEGAIHESGTAAQIFSQPQTARLQAFLKRYQDDGQAGLRRAS